MSKLNDMPIRHILKALGKPAPESIKAAAYAEVTCRVQALYDLVQPHLGMLQEGAELRKHRRAIAVAVHNFFEQAPSDFPPTPGGEDAPAERPKRERAANGPRMEPTRATAEPEDDEDEEEAPKPRAKANTPPFPIGTKVIFRGKQYVIEAWDGKRLTLDPGHGDPNLRITEAAFADVLKYVAPKRDRDDTPAKATARVRSSSPAPAPKANGAPKVDDLDDLLNDVLAGDDD